MLLVGVHAMPGMANGQPAEVPNEQQAMPLGPVEAILLRSTLIAINQANATGDYGVLRGLIAPDVARALSPDVLAADFRPWREKRRDIGFAVIAEPRLSASAAQTPSGERHLVGTVPTPGFLLAFDFSFRKVDDRWLLTKFSVSDGALTVSSAPPEPVAGARTGPEPSSGPARTVSDFGPAKAPPLPPDRPWF